MFVNINYQFMNINGLPTGAYDQMSVGRVACLRLGMELMQM